VADGNTNPGGQTNWDDAVALREGETEAVADREPVAVAVMDKDAVVDLVLDALEEMLPLLEMDNEGVAVKEADAVRDELDDGKNRDGASQQAGAFDEQ
jgi:hypothetical protein